MEKRKATYEQEQALAAGRAVARRNQRARVAARQEADAATAARLQREADEEAQRTELRCGFKVGDRVRGRDYFWNEWRTGTVVEGDLYDGVPVLCDDGEQRTLYRRSLEATT